MGQRDSFLKAYFCSQLCTVKKNLIECLHFETNQLVVIRVAHQNETQRHSRTLESMFQGQWPKN